MLSLALFPVLSNLSIQDRGKFAEVTRKAIGALFLLTCPLSVAFYVLAQPLILFLYGSHFLKAVPILQITCWGVVFFSLNQLFWILFFSLKLEKKVLFISGTVLVVNICLNLWLIPKLGYRGASWSLVVSEAMWTLLNLYFLKDYLPLAQIFNRMFRILLCASAAGMYLWEVKALPWPISVAASACLYFLLLYWTKVLNKDNYHLLKNVLGFVPGYKKLRGNG